MKLNWSSGWPMPDDLPTQNIGGSVKQLCRDSGRTIGYAVKTPHFVEWLKIAEPMGWVKGFHCVRRHAGLQVQQWWACHWVGISLKSTGAKCGGSISYLLFFPLFLPNDIYSNTLPITMWQHSLYCMGCLVTLSRFGPANTFSNLNHIGGVLQFIEDT